MGGEKNEGYLNQDREINLGNDTLPEEKTYERATWASDWEFIISCIALVIGLGNVWRFPFIAFQNGGGAFLIPYLIVLLLIGQPAYYLELLIGQFSSRGCIKMYEMAPAMRGIGYGQTMGVFMTATYYTALIALALRFFIVSFQGVLPWSVCKPEWGPECIDSARNGSFLNPNGTISSSELYFYREILRELPTIADGIGEIDWKLVLCLGFAWMCIVLILIRGIRSSGKVAYFLAIFPYVIMIILLVRAVTLPGSADGILYLLTPQWSELANPDVWFAAVSQVFYSLAIFLGEIIIYASHSRFDQPVFKVAATIVVVDTITSLTSGIIIFGILGNLAFEIGTDDISTVVRGGTGLAFVSYPDAIAKFEWLPQLFSTTFFLMLFIIGLGCVVGLQICVLTSIQDRFQFKKPFIIILTIAIVQFSIGLMYITQGGQYLVNMIDFYCVSFLIFVMGIFELITVCWMYGIKQVCRDAEYMLNMKINIYWRICWGVVTPLLLIIIFIYSVVSMEPLTYNDYVYPDGFYALGWSLSAVGLLQIPFWMGYEIYTQKGLTLRDKITAAFRPINEWGPLDPLINKGYQRFMNEKKNSEVEKNGFFNKLYDHIFG